MHQLTPRELADWLADEQRSSPCVLDVREGWEWDTCRIEGARHMPMRTVPALAGELPLDEPIVVVCHHGIRSMQVASFLMARGFGRVFNLAGGIAAWASDVAPEMPRY